MVPIILTQNDIRRFITKTMHNETTGCVEWTGQRRCAFGYGSITVKGRHLLAHRVAWTIANGPIPLGMCVLHHCDNPRCVSPGHLFLGTHADNNVDKELKGRANHPERGRDLVAPERRARGERQWKAKLTAMQVAEIRSKHFGMTQAEIGSLYGVSQGTIGNVLAGNTWRHVR